MPQFAFLSASKPEDIPPRGHWHLGGSLVVISRPPSAFGGDTFWGGQVIWGGHDPPKWDMTPPQIGGVKITLVSGMRDSVRIW